MPFHAGDAVLAERLMDWCFQLNDKQKNPATILLCGSQDCHAELKTKVKIAAEVAFESVIELDVALIPQPNNVTGKGQLIGRSLMRIATYVGRNSRWPYLLIEPDCVPLSKGWLEKISAAYDDQHRRYLGNYMRMTTTDGDKRFMGRVAVYPLSALNDINTKYDTVPACTKTRLIQHMTFTGIEDTEKIWPEAVLIHGDKTGALIEHLRGGAGEFVESLAGAIVDDTEDAHTTHGTDAGVTSPIQVVAESMEKLGRTPPASLSTSPVSPAQAAAAAVAEEDGPKAKAEEVVPQIVGPPPVRRQTIVKAPQTQRTNGR